MQFLLIITTLWGHSTFGPFATAEQCRDNVTHIRALTPGAGYECRAVPLDRG